MYAYVWEYGDTTTEYIRLGLKSYPPPLTPREKKLVLSIQNLKQLGYENLGPDIV